MSSTQQIFSRVLFFETFVLPFPSRYKKCYPSNGDKLGYIGLWTVDKASNGMAYTGIFNFSLVNSCNSLPCDRCIVGLQSCDK